MFSYTGIQRSLARGCFHADAVVNSVSAVPFPYMPCAAVLVQNDPESTGNALIGSNRLAIIGEGQILQPGEFSGWIPVKNLNLIWHKELDATTTLNYMIVGCLVGGPPNPDPSYLLCEQGGYVLLESGDRIAI